MDTDRRNYIYAYDEDEGQIIILDAESGERIGKKENRVQPVLEHLRQKGEKNKLRKFTIWCTYKCNDHIKPVQRKFLQLAERALQGKADLQELRDVYTQSENQAVAVDTVGLRQGSVKAPGFLASRECVNPDTFEGANKAARFHCLWAEINHSDDNNDDKKQLPAGMEKIAKEKTKNVLEETEQAQIDYLLELIGV